LIRRGIPTGGNSAGLAILVEFSFSALRDSADSKETLQNPYNDRVTITRDFLQIPPLRSIITETHFVKRDRLGRLLGFMARITQDGESKHIRAIAVDQDNTVLLDADGQAEITGTAGGRALRIDQDLRLRNSASRRMVPAFPCRTGHPFAV
jgi:cyanophycinase-like exopeptidase